MNSKHYEIIDVIKGITILLVLIGHVLLSVINKSNLGTESLFYQTNLILNEFHMPLFFLVSGLFVDGFIKKDLLTALESKTTRLLMPYFIWSFIIASSFEVFKMYADSLNIGYSLLLKSWYLPFWQFWFLYYLFFMFLFTLVLSRIIPNYYKISLVVIASIGYILYSLQVIPDFWILPLLGRYLIYFAIGTVSLTAFKSVISIDYKVLHLLLSLVLFSASIYGYFYIKEELPKYIYAYRFLVAVSGINFTWIIAKWICSNFTKIAEILKSFGYNSMIVYCIHSSFILILSKIWRYLFGNSLIWEQAILLSIIVSYICWFVSEKIFPPNSNFRILFGEFKTK